MAPLTIMLAAPRGFCAGVERAILIVENALRIYGPPVYVRHEIVHNAHVVGALREKGAVFVEELDEIPDTDQPVIFSAHGVPKSIPQIAGKRNLFHIDATCPLVSKVHIEAERHHRSGREVLLIGHKGHPEVDGTMGQLPAGAMSLIETVEDAETFTPRDPERLALATQTTLSVDDTREIVDCLVRRFPAITIPHKEDICYATTNRQAAVKQIAPRADAVIVVGATNSSNSRRLVEVARRAGCRRSFLVTCADDIDWDRLGEVRRVGITAGASAPEVLVRQVTDAFAARYDAKVENVVSAEETITFK
ncbi:MAG: 4-hydroxy-3-methylbut-2-enyl diphosphate reductase, partial [Rhizobiales bacterium]|nr:4-hydroxy-3-methylbut-2-enyl diphosphate reductase [Hyphomicrobiales bacterium]